MSIEKDGAVRIMAQKVVMAWTVEGPRPDIHRAAQAKLRKEWPTLYRAIVDLVREEML